MLEVGIPAFSRAEGAAAAAGVLLAIWSFGSGIGGLLYGTLPRRARPVPDAPAGRRAAAADAAPARRRAVGVGDGAARDPRRLLHRAAARDPQRAGRRRRAAGHAHRGLHVADHRRSSAGSRSAPRCAGVLVEGPGWRTAFVVAAGFAAVGALLAVLLAPDGARPCRVSVTIRPRLVVAYRESMADPLAHFTPQVREWFGRAFAEPTAAQAQAWPAIATGEHVLISAPTGSGKTLAAFLYGLDQFVARPTHEQTRLVYVSPLKALSYDVEKNLRAPLRGIGAELNVAIRTGDTPQKERRDMVKHPPDVLITTPESLYLMLTSQAREIFEGTETVILDEIHAVAQTKRGAHLAITLERLVEQAGPRRPAGRPLRHAEPAGGGRALHGRPDAAGDGGGHRRAQAAGPEDPRAGGVDGRAGEHGPRAGPVRRARRRRASRSGRRCTPSCSSSCASTRSTLIFVNNRRAAERLALRLNELAEENIARAHHGIAGARGAAGRRGAAQGGRAAVPGRDVVAGAGHRHGRGRPRAAGRVAEVGHRRPAAHRPRRPQRRRHLQGPHLPQVPRRPARVRGRRAADARGQDRDDGRPAQPARRARPADRRDGRLGRGRGAVGRPAGGDAGPHLHVRRALARAARERARHARRALSERGVRRAAAADRLGPRGGDDPRPQGLARAGDHQRGHDPRPRPVLASTSRTAAASASSTRRWSTRRARARSSCSARRRGGSRRSRATA